MGGNKIRRSSNVVLRESLRFCSAALCDVLRPCIFGAEATRGVEVVSASGGVAPATEEDGVKKIGRGMKAEDGPGRMAFRLGLTREPFTDFRGVLVRGARGASPVAFACFAVVLPFASGFCAIASREGGARLLLMPSRPRFIMLAGVTGVSCGCGCDCGLKFGEGGWLLWWLWLWLSCEVFEAEDEDEDVGLGGTGGAGGGIERSTGEGVSPGTSPAVLPFRERVERRRGVELVDLEPLKTFLFRVGFVGRIAGDCCFFREGCIPLSSSLDEAWRLLEELCTDCWCAPSQGLVRGEMSKSRSAGEGRAWCKGLVRNAMCSGAEVDPRGER